MKGAEEILSGDVEERFFLLAVLDPRGIAETDLLEVSGNRVRGRGDGEEATMAGDRETAGRRPLTTDATSTSTAAAVQGLPPSSKAQSEGPRLAKKSFSRACSSFSHSMISRAFFSFISQGTNTCFPMQLWPEYFLVIRMGSLEH
jgi:hypothetical protein